MNPPPVHVVVTDEVAERPRFREIASGMLATLGPGLALHLRLRRRSGRDLHVLAGELSAHAAASGAWCVVNRRVDVALAAGAQAVQLGRSSLPVRATRAVLPRGTAVGVSAHDRAAVVRGRDEGADYVLLGTIFPTPSHPGGTTGGPDLVRSAADVGLPVVAIGGVTVERAPELLDAGACGVAVIRAVWDMADPLAAARELEEVFTGCGGDVGGSWGVDPVE